MRKRPEDPRHEHTFDDKQGKERITILSRLSDVEKVGSQDEA
jgi:hypothetical protein